MAMLPYAEPDTGSERALNDKPDGPPPGIAQDRFAAGSDDLIILPAVLIALATTKLFRALISLLVHILDYAFPILLQLARFPLFTARIVGDGVTALLKGAVGYLPVSGAKRQEWRDRVSRRWSWLRQKISYKAFEEAVHHAFESGMAWVFRKCRTLTPRDALLVIVCAVLWLPISFGVATAMHVALLAWATSLPAWMQLLHPVATIIAKSKLLVLPAYPAAWPQAKKHPFVEGMTRFYRYLTSLRFVRKMGYRYRQAEHATVGATGALGRFASFAGLSHLSGILLAGLRAAGAWIGALSRAAMRRTVEGLSGAPLFGPVVRRYSEHYDGVHQHGKRVSERISESLQHWSIKFSAEYYEAKEREEAARVAHVLAGEPVSTSPEHALAATPASQFRSDQASQSSANLSAPRDRSVPSP
jgi:hypothetical protein